MARIRTIKPEFFTSEQIVECSTNARLLFVGMWCFCDDAGRHPASTLRLKMEIYPGDSFSDSDIRGFIEELKNNNLIDEYTAQGIMYWEVTGWSKHQKIDRPNIKYPGKFDECSTNARRMLDERSPPESSRVESKGVEWNGMESNRSIDRTPDKVFDYGSENCELKTRVVAKVKEVHRRIWPNVSTLKDRDRQEIVIACYLAEVILSQNWIESAIESAARPGVDKPGAYFRKCLVKGADALGYDYHNLTSKVIIPKKKQDA